MRRLSRFSALALMKGQEVLAHVPNSGRLGELLVGGANVWVLPATNVRRRTAWDLALVEQGDSLVSVDSRHANGVVAGAIADDRLVRLQGYPRCHREVRVGKSRLDFCLEGAAGRCFVEAKSVTLVKHGVALFPDAPTLRGARHARQLAELVVAGNRCALIFVVLRSDATAFAPYSANDPKFDRALRDAAEAGVIVQAYRCDVSLEGAFLADEIPVIL